MEMVGEMISQVGEYKCFEEAQRSLLYQRVSRKNTLHNWIYLRLHFPRLSQCPRSFHSALTQCFRDSHILQASGWHRQVCLHASSPCWLLFPPIGITPLRVKVAVEMVSAHEGMESVSATTATGHPRKVVMGHLLPFGCGVHQIHHPMVLHWVHRFQVHRHPNHHLDQHRRQDYSKISSDLGCAAPGLGWMEETGSVNGSWQKIPMCSWYVEVVWSLCKVFSSRTSDKRRATSPGSSTLWLKYEMTPSDKFLLLTDSFLVDWALVPCV